MVPYSVEMSSESCDLWLLDANSARCFLRFRKAGGGKTSTNFLYQKIIFYASKIQIDQSVGIPTILPKKLLSRSTFWLCGNSNQIDDYRNSDQRNEDLYR